MAELLSDPRLRETVPGMLRAAACRWPDGIALIAARASDPGDLCRITFDELDAASSRVAGGLQEHGVQHGDRVGLLLDNTAAYEAQVTFHAVHKLGAINVPLNTRFVAPELATALDIAGITCVVADHRFVETLNAALAISRREAVVITVGQGPEGARWDELLLAEPETRLPRTTDDADWIFTSGTTGTPKAAMFTHSASVACGIGVANAWDLRAGDVYQSASPLFTSTGIHSNPLGALIAGATYLPDPEPSLGGFLDRAAAHGTTCCLLITTMLALLVDEYEDRIDEMRALRRVVYGGMPVSPARHLEFNEVFTQRRGIELVHLMGLTEGGPSGVYLRPQDHARKPGSIGDRPFARWTDFKVVDDTRDPVAVGELGELMYRGPSIMRGYLDPDASTSRGLEDGWLATGDIVRQDEDGHLYFVDRKKDIVRRGGLNISAAEVETVLAAAPGIKAAAVVPKPHNVLGEDLCAFVEIDPDVHFDPGAVRDFALARLSGFKVPREIRVISELPRNAMGRVVKAELRHLAEISSPPSEPARRAAG